MSAAVTLQQCCRSVAAINVRQSIVRYMRDALTFKLLYIEYFATTFWWEKGKKKGIVRGLRALLHIITSGPDCTLISEFSTNDLCILSTQSGSYAFGVV